MNSVVSEDIRSLKGFDYAVQLTRMLLKPCGLWPLKYTKYQTCLNLILIILCFFIMMFMLVPLCLFMFLIVKDVRIRLKLVGPVGFSLMNLFKYAVVIIKRHEITDCLNEMANDWRRAANDAERRIMLKNAKTGRMLTIFCMLLMYGGGMPYVTIVPLTKGAMLVGNVSYRHLAYPSYFIFFNPHIRPVYDLVFLVQCLCGFIRYTITCGVYSIIIVCVMHICSQITITCLMIQKLTAEFDNRSLGTIVEQHLHFLNFSKKLNEIFKEISLIEVFGSTCEICMIGYYIITEFEQRESIATVTFLLLLSSFIFNIFILCYIGEILTAQCESIGTTAFTIDWYKLSGKEAKNIILLVSSKQRPVSLTAGKLMKLSLQRFSNIIKAAASYLNLLRTALANES